jgi:hypothetical protein
MDRREFLQGGAAAFVTLTLSPWLVGSTGPVGGPLRKADFEALLHTWFHVGGPAEGWQSVELVSVRDDGSSARIEQFTVAFRGSPSLELAEGTHTLSPAAGDDLELFLQPGEGDGSGRTVVARFSLIRPESLAPPSCAPRA